MGSNKQAAVLKPASRHSRKLAECVCIRSGLTLDCPLDMQSVCLDNGLAVIDQRGLLGKWADL
jgi:hypothetical protein